MNSLHIDGGYQTNAWLFFYSFYLFIYFSVDFIFILSFLFIPFTTFISLTLPPFFVDTYFCSTWFISSKYKSTHHIHYTGFLLSKGFYHSFFLFLFLFFCGNRNGYPYPQGLFWHLQGYGSCFTFLRGSLRYCCLLAGPLWLVCTFAKTSVDVSLELFFPV